MNINKFIEDFFYYFKYEKYEIILNSYEHLINDVKKNEVYFNLFLKILKSVKIKNNKLVNIFKADDFNSIFSNEFIEPKTKINFWKTFYSVKKLEFNNIFYEGFIKYNKIELVNYGKEIIKFLNNFFELSIKIEYYQNDLKVIFNFFKIFYKFFEISYIFVEGDELIFEMCSNLKNFYSIILKPIYDTISQKYKNIKFYQNFLKIQTVLSEFILMITYLCLNNYTIQKKGYYDSVLKESLEVAKNLIQMDILYKIKEVINDPMISKEKIKNRLEILNIDSVDQSILKKDYTAIKIDLKKKLEIVYSKYVGSMYFYLNIIKDEIEYLPKLNNHLYIKKKFIYDYINNDKNEIYNLKQFDITINIKSIYKQNKNYLLEKFNLEEIDSIWEYFKNINFIDSSIISKVNKDLFDKNLLDIIKDYNNYINPIDFSYSIRKFMEQYLTSVIILKDHFETFNEEIFKDLFTFEINKGKNVNKILEEEKIVMKIVAIINFIDAFEPIIITHYLSNNSLNSLKDLIKNYFLVVFNQEEIHDEEDDEKNFFEEILNLKKDEQLLYEYINEKMFNKRKLYFKNDTKKKLKIELKLRILKFLRKIEFSRIFNENVNIFELFNLVDINPFLNFISNIKNNLKKYYDNEYILELIFHIIHFENEKIVLTECYDLLILLTEINKDIYFYEEFHLSLGLYIYENFSDESNKYQKYINNIIEVFSKLFEYEENIDKPEYNFLKKISKLIINNNECYYINSNEKFDFKNNLKEIMIRDDIYLDFKLFQSYRVFVTNTNMLYVFEKFLFIYEAREIINGNYKFNFSLFYFIKNIKNFYFERKKIKKHEKKDFFWKFKEDGNSIIIRNIFDLFPLVLKGDKFSNDNNKKKLNEDNIKILSLLLKLINNILEANNGYIYLFYTKYLKSKINDIDYLMKTEIKKNSEASNLFIMHYFNLMMTLLDNDSKKIKNFLIKFLDINEIYFSICKLVLKFYSNFIFFKKNGNLNLIQIAKLQHIHKENTKKENTGVTTNTIKERKLLLENDSKIYYQKTIDDILLDEDSFLNNKIIDYKSFKKAYIEREENDNEFYEILDNSIKIFSKLSNLKSDFVSFNLFFLSLKKSYKFYSKYREKTNPKQIYIDKIFYLSTNQQLEIFEFLNKIVASVRISNDENVEVKIYFSKEPKSLFLKKKVKDEYMNIYNYSNIETKNLELMNYFDYFLKYCELDYEIYYNKNIFFNFLRSSNKLYKIILMILWTLGFIMNIVSLFTFTLINDNIGFQNNTLDLILTILNYSILSISSFFLINWFIFRYYYTLQLERKKYEINNIFAKKNKFNYYVEIFLLNSIIKNYRPLLFFFHIVLCVLYIIGYKIFYSFHFFSIIFLSETINFIISSITNQLFQFFSSLFLAALIIYSYSNLLIQYFRNDINTGSTINYCNNVFNCFINTLNYGFRGPEGLEGLIPRPEFNTNQFYVKFIFDIFFFLLINIFFLNIIQSIIVDQFNSTREEKSLRILDQNNFCMICGIERKFYVKKSKNFDYHLEVRHNFLNYFHFYVYLINKYKKFIYYDNQQNKQVRWKKEYYFFSKTEKYVFNCIKHKLTEWFPKFELNEDEDNLIKQLNDILIGIKEINNID